MLNLLMVLMFINRGSSEINNACLLASVTDCIDGFCL